MKTSLKVLAISVAIGTASIASTANAWWVPFFGDGYGNGNMSFNMSARGHGNGWGDYDRYDYGSYRPYHRAYGPAIRDHRDDQFSRRDGERARDFDGYNGYENSRQRDYYASRGYGSGRANGGFNFNMNARAAGDAYGDQYYDPYYDDRGYEADRRDRNDNRESVPTPEAEAELKSEG